MRVLISCLVIGFTGVGLARAEDVERGIVLEGPAIAAW
jgi:hypothetical protein